MVRQTLAIIGAALCLHVAPAAALTIGELKMHSSFGQPFRATIPVTIKAGETLAKNCISQLENSTADNRMNALRNVEVRVPATSQPGTYIVSLRGFEALNEPMYELALRVQCSGAVNSVRSFVVLLGIPGVDNAIPEYEDQPVTVTASRPVPVKRQQSPARAAVTPLNPGAQYLVVNGDSLSSVAARIEPAWGSLRQRGDALFATNPHAFINGDRLRIKAGTLITIPEGTPAPAAQQAPAPVTFSDTPTVDPAIAAAGSGTRSIATDATTTSTPAISAPIVRTAAEPTAATAPEAVDDDLSGAYVAAMTAADVAREARLAGETEAAGTAAVAAPVPEEFSLWPVFLIGGMLGLAVAALMLGRKAKANRRRIDAAIEKLKAKQAKEAAGEAGSRPADSPIAGEIEVNEDEANFRKTIASDHMATSAFQRMEMQHLDNNSSGNEHDDTHDPLDDTADELPRSTVNSGFLDSSPDVFDATATDVTASTTMANDASVQEIFDEALFEDPDDPDAPSADRVEAAKAAAADLQRLKKSADEHVDEELSATLVEALDLLEQDYNEELSASQILEKNRVDQAVSQQGKADNNK